MWQAVWRYGPGHLSGEDPRIDGDKVSECSCASVPCLPVGTAVGLQ
jgi:hypothetical protein